MTKTKVNGGNETRGKGLLATTTNGTGFHTCINARGGFLGHMEVRLAPEAEVDPDLSVSWSSEKRAPFFYNAAVTKASRTYCGTAGKGSHTLKNFFLFKGSTLFSTKGLEQSTYDFTGNKFSACVNPYLVHERQSVHPHVNFLHLFARDVETKTTNNTDRYRSQNFSTGIGHVEFVPTTHCANPTTSTTESTRKTLEPPVHHKRDKQNIFFQTVCVSAAMTWLLELERHSASVTVFTHIQVAPKYKTHPNFDTDFLVLGFMLRNLVPMF